MIRELVFTSVLTVVCVAGLRAHGSSATSLEASFQQRVADTLAACQGGAAPRTPYKVSRTVRGPVTELVQAARDTIAKEGYAIEVASDSIQTTIHVPITRWPHPTGWGTDHWREHAHPGVDLFLTLWPRGDSTELTVEAQARCVPTDDRRCHDESQVIDAAQRIAGDGLAAAMLTVYNRSHRPREPRRAAMTLPEIHQCPEPSLPDSLRNQEISGTVELTVLVREDGTPDEEATRVDASPHPALGALARTFVAACQFKPGSLDGKPAAIAIELSVEFRD